VDESAADSACSSIGPPTCKQRDAQAGAGCCTSIEGRAYAVQHDNCTGSKREVRNQQPAGRCFACST
jgi:hypothetical protein